MATTTPSAGERFAIRLAGGASAAGGSAGYAIVQVTHVIPAAAETSSDTRLLRDEIERRFASDPLQNWHAVPFAVAAASPGKTTLASLVGTSADRDA